MKNKTKIRNASIVLALVLGLFLFAAKDMMKSSDPQQEGKFRFPASHIFGEMRSASTAVEKRYAAQLAIPGLKKRKIASIGRPASPIENLRFGILEGKYAVTMDGERIQELNFVDTPESDGRPASVGSRAEFLSKFAALFGFSGTPEKLSVDIKGTNVVETYKVPSKQGSQLIVRVVLDNSDRLINLQTQQILAGKIF